MIMIFCCDGQYIYVKSENNPTDELGKITLATQTELFRVSNNCGSRKYTF